MSTARQMLETYPGEVGFDADQLSAAIEAAFDCAQACTACADACLAEEGHAGDLARCIRLDSDCADVTRAVLQACVEVCRSCASECEGHDEDMDMDHCGVCAAACRRCEAACRALLDAIGA